MRKALIVTLIGLSTLVFSQPAKADSNRSYSSAYKAIATTQLDSYKNQKFRVYVLKWLEQDRSYPHKVAISYCQDRRSGFSESQILEWNIYKLIKRKSVENWSQSRLEAYLDINAVGIAIGLTDHCPEFLDKDINQ